MNRRIKFGLISFLPLLVVLSLFCLIMIFNLNAYFYTLILISMILLPYTIAFFIEYSENLNVNRENLSESELNLIQENKNIIKSLEIIIISFSFLFGLFTSIQFDLQIVGNDSYQLMNLLASLFGVNFFLATFVFLQTQVLGKDAFLIKPEIESLSLESHKTPKITQLVKKMRFANFIRKGCYYSLLIQITLVYPLIMANILI